MAPSGDRVLPGAHRFRARLYASGELWSLNLTTGEKERVLPGSLMAYSRSRPTRSVVFTSAGNETGDGVWIADLDRRSPPRQLTRGGEFRAFFGAPGEIVYMTQGEVRHLYRMKEDGSGTEMILPDPITYLIAVSPDGRWAAAIVPRTSTGGGTRIQMISLRGERSIFVCNEDCAVGFGPNRIQAPMFNWSMDGKWLFVGLQYFGVRTARTVVLPYRSGVPLETLWPNGLISEEGVVANPGAKIINEGNAFPASTGSPYLFWRLATQSNLYRVALPN